MWWPQIFKQNTNINRNTDTNGSTQKHDLHIIVHIRECVSETFHSKSLKLEIKRRRWLYIQISVDSLCFCSTLTSEIEKSAVTFTPDERLTFRNCFGFCWICSLVDCIVHLIRFLKCYRIVDLVTSHRIQRFEFLFNPKSLRLIFALVALLWDILKIWLVYIEKITKNNKIASKKEVFQFHLNIWFIAWVVFAS